MTSHAAGDGRPRFARVAVAALLALGVLAVVLGVALPFARAQALGGVQDRAGVYARDALRRAEETAGQAAEGRAAIKAAMAAGEASCSPELIARMRALDLRARYVQAFGIVANDVLVCSSANVAHLRLGPVDTVTRLGARIYTQVHLPGDPDTEYVVTVKSGIAAVVDLQLPIDITAEPGVAVAEFNTIDHAVVAARGDWSAELLDSGLARVPTAGDRPESTQLTFTQDDQVIAAATSRNHFLGTVVVIPAADVTAAIRRTTLLVLPLGLLGGLLLGIGVLRVVRRRRSLPAVLRAAFLRREIFLVYQPIVDVRTGRWIGAEALARWQRPSGELIPPDVFVPVAETSGLSQALTTYVVQALCPDLVQFLEHDPEFLLSVNVTHDDLRSEESVRLFERLLRDTGVPPAQVVLEVTERRPVDTAQCKPVIQSLRRLGITLSLDDFGTGYSNLSYLQTLEIDAVKIDKSFVETSETSAATASVMKHIVDIADALELKIVAEGVETSEQAAMVRRYGVPWAQGWLYSRPLRAADLLEHLRTRDSAEPYGTGAGSRVEARRT